MDTDITIFNLDNLSILFISKLKVLGIKNDKPKMYKKRKRYMGSLFEEKNCPCNEYIISL